MFNMSDSRLASVDFIIQMRQNVIRGAVVSVWDLVANCGRFHRNPQGILYHRPRCNMGDENRIDVIQHKTNKSSQNRSALPRR